MISDDDLLRMASRIARRYHVDGMTYDDLVQEAFIAGFTARDRPPSHTYNVMRRHMRSLYRAANRDVVDYRRSPPVTPDRSLSPLDALVFQETLDAVLSALTPRERLIFLNRHFPDDYLASVLHLTTAAIRKIRSRAAKKVCHKYPP